jgi:hypothetical protein
MQPLLTRVLWAWVPLVVVFTVVFFGIYLVMQQTFRSAANHPQIELAEKARDALVAGTKQPQDLIAAEPKVDIVTSKTAFLAVYDESGNLLESSGTLGALTPVPPFGVFEAAKQRGENRVTWAPSADTRIALVVVPAAIESGWFVASGRNLRETESLINTVQLSLFGAWILALIVSLVTIGLVQWFRRA